MNNFEMCDLIAKEICDVKSDYGHTLKTQDYIYVAYGRVLDKLSEQPVTLKDLNDIAYLIRKGVQEIEKEKH